MKISVIKFFLLCTTLFLAALSAQAQPSLQKTYPERKDANHRHKYDYSTVLTIVKDGVWNAVIAVSPDARPAARYAASELQTYLGEAAGSKITISEKLSPDKINILVGSGSLITSAGINTVTPAVRDSFIIKFFKTKSGEIIHVLGNDDLVKSPEKLSNSGSWENLFEKGTLFGVYDFLERYCGAGFYFPGSFGTAIPVQKNIVIPAMDIYEAPDWIFRTTSPWSRSFAAVDGISRIPGGYPHTAPEYVSWVHRERLINRHETRFIPRCHGLTGHGLIERFGKSNPEYFALLPDGRRDNDLTKQHPGQLCYTSRKVEDEVVADIVSFNKGEPAEKRNIYRERWKRAVWDPSFWQPGFVNVMPQDSFGEHSFCRCDSCKPFYTTDGNYSDYIFGFVARVAEKVKLAAPEMTITTMAYASYTHVPSIKFPDNVRVMLALMGPWEEKYPAQQKENDAFIHEWNQKMGGGRTISLWTYVNDYNRGIPPGVPPLSVRQISSYYKRNAPYILGTYQENEIQYRLHQYLNNFIFYKIAWDNQADTEKLLAEHYSKMFGPAAAEIEKIFNRLEHVWTNRGISEIKKTPAGPMLTPHTDDVLWNKIYSAALLEEISGLLGTAETKVSSDKLIAGRIVYFKEHFFGPLFNSRNAYFSGKREIEDLVFSAPEVMDMEIRVNGTADEDAWTNAPRYGLKPLTQKSAPKVLTDVQFLYGKKNLYVSINCRDDLVDKMQYMKRPADDTKIWQDSSIEIFLNPSGDRRTYYQMILNPAGSFSDLQISAPGQYDYSWTSKANYKTKITEEGWSAEIAVPFASIYFTPKKHGMMIVNTGRSRYIKNDPSATELQTLSPFLRGKFHDPENFGAIIFSDETGVNPREKNYITNGSFENYNGDFVPDAWTIEKGWSSAVITVVESDFMQGRTCIKMSSEENSDAKRVLVTQYIEPLKPNKLYQVTFFIKVENFEVDPAQKYSGAYVNVYGSPGNRFFPNEANWHKKDTDWKKESYTFKTADKATEINYVRVGFMAAKGVVYFDDVRLREAE